MENHAVTESEKSSRTTTGLDANRNLLLVDDEINIIQALKRLLRREGYNIFTANSGKQGLEILKKEKIGVILSDQRMPEMTGSEFLHQVKLLYPDTVRIVLSGYTDLKSVTDSINEGAIYKFFTKPWDDNLLKKLVAEAFEHFELRKENVRLTAELTAINRELEQTVIKKSRQANLNIRALNFSQILLDKLPVAIAGLSDDKTIVLTNQLMVSSIMHGNPMIGMPAEMVFSEEIIQSLEKCDDNNINAVSFNLNISDSHYQCKCNTVLNSENERSYIIMLIPL